MLVMVYISFERMLFVFDEVGCYYCDDFSICYLVEKLEHRQNLVELMLWVPCLMK